MNGLIKTLKDYVIIVRIRFQEIRIAGELDIERSCHDEWHTHLCEGYNDFLLIRIITNRPRLIVEFCLLIDGY